MPDEYDFACEPQNDRLVVRGDCDIVASRQLGEQIAAYDGRPLELDLKGVTFFDSAALQVLLRAHERNPQLRVGDVSQDVALVLKISGTYRRLRQARGDAASTERDVATA
jgi:anti-anti-sigma factor